MARCPAPAPPWSLAGLAALATAAMAVGGAPAAAAPEWLPERGPRRAAVIEARVTEQPAEDVWQITYVLPERAAGVEMVRARHARRHLGWGLAPAGSTWHRSGNAERICFPQAVRTFAVSFRSDFTKPEKDYEPNIAWSDGSRLLYTGNLLVRPLARCGPGEGPEAAEPLPRAVDHQFRFETTAGRSIHVSGQAAEASLLWRPGAGHEDTYVYFGSIPPVVSDRAVSLLDPSLPEWLANDLRLLLPRLFDHFAGETGVSLPVRPLVLVGYQPGGSGRSFSGGVLNDLVSIALSGEGWAAPSDEVRRDWLLRLAHEAFHLWGGATLRTDQESEWLSEAGAEVFALRAAVGLGVLTPRDHEAAIVTLANRCLVEVEGAPLLAAPERGTFGSWYSCGPTLLFVADRAVERARPGYGGLGLLFREMFAEARLAGDVYGTGVFLGWLDKLSGDRATVFALQRLIRQGVPAGADRFLEDLLRGAGLKVALVPLEEANGAGTVFGPLLRRAVVRCACGTAAPQASSDPDCARFAPDSPLRTVDGIPARQRPAEAYARLRAGVMMARPLQVVAGEDDQAVALLCPRDTLETSFERLLKLQ
jgi:hypothetical protein